MSNLTIEIRTPDILEAAKVIANTIMHNTAIPAPPTPCFAPAPTIVAPVQTQPIQNPVVAPVQAPQPVTAPAPVVAQTITTVPTAAPATYSLSQLQTACAPLMDAGKTQDICNLLNSLGARALTELPESLFGEFATALRGLGAKL